MGWHFLQERWRFEVDQFYDLENGDRNQQRYLINFNGQCVGIIGEYSVFNFTGSEEDYEFRVALTLPSIGTFLDLRRGGSGLFENSRYSGSRGTPF